MLQLRVQLISVRYWNSYTSSGVPTVLIQPKAIALLVAACCALLWLAPKPAACQQRPIRTPSAECSKAADAKERRCAPAISGKLQ